MYISLQFIHNLLDPPTNVTVVGESAVVEGTDLVLNCSAVGDPEPTYQWLRSGSVLPSKVTDTNTAQLVIPSMTWSDVGVYYCLAVNEGGVSYSPAIHVLLQAEQGAVISNRNGILFNTLPNTDFPSPYQFQIHKRDWIWVS